MSCECCRKEECPDCGELIDGPVKLPCKHTLCLKCVVLRKQLLFYYCPTCEKPFPEDFKAEVIASKKLVYVFIVMRLCVH